MDWGGTYTHENGKEYRWSMERAPSGRPMVAQFQKPDGSWLDVRNMDVLDGIWNLACGLCFDHDHRKGQ